MNSLGRHYRDQGDTSNPTCDYENCDFFLSGHEFSYIPYPADISLGPVSETPASSAPQQQSELALIMEMLRKQQADSERTNAQMIQLQNQVNSMMSNSIPNVLSRNPIATSQPASNPTQTAPQYTQTYPTQSTPSFAHSFAQTSATTFTTSVTAPHVVANAAANLTAALQGGLGHSNNYGYNGLTINQLRGNPTVSAVGNATLATAIRDVPPLNPQSVKNLGPMLNIVVNR